MADYLSKPIFNDADKAREWLEARLWPDGPICPHCGTVDEATLMKGKTTRPGLYQCNACREPFTVTVGTLYERSKIALHIWLKATYLLMASKKGISKNQMSRMLGVSQKSAWFLRHRIREALKGDNALLGSTGGPVEVDETFIGRKTGVKVATGYEHKRKVLALVDRSTGRARSMVVDKLTIGALLPILEANIAKEAHVMTDQAGYYRYLSKTFRMHSTVNHAVSEYVRGETHTNTIEGYFSIFKRGMKGVYQHCGEGHLNRYLAEFDFRYSNRVKLGVDDMTRTERAVDGIVGKRLTYRRLGGEQPQAH